MLRVLELFAGIGACSKALERLGIEHEIVDAVEIDKYAIKSFNAVHGTNFDVQDITKWDKNIEVDLVMHGSPCQDFSVAGKQAGGDIGSGTRSSLMYETVRIVGKLRPKYVIWENVKNVLSKTHKHNFDRYIETMEALGYSNFYKVLDAKDYGVPQHRERVFTVSILGDGEYEFPEKEELKIRLKDILEDEVDEKYYLNEVQIKRIETTTYNVGKTRIQKKEYCDTLCARDWKDPKCVQVGQMDSCSGGNRQPKIEVKENYGTATAIIEENNRNAKHQQDLLQHKEDVCKCVPAGTHGSTPHLLKTIVNDYPLIIRKLTPKECWRLMGFDDEDFEKARAVGISNTQLYKQAGNSIVVNVLEKILEKLL